MKSLRLALLGYLLCLWITRLGAADLPNLRRTEVIYGRKFGTALTLDVLQPAKANGLGVIWVISGGFYSDHNGINPAYCKALIDEGYTVFAVLLGLSLFPTAKELMELAKDGGWLADALSHLPAREKLPAARDLLSVFANEAPITVAAMFVLSHALIKCGMMDLVADGMVRFGRVPLPVFLFVLVMLVPRRVQTPPRVAA